MHHLGVHYIAISEPLTFYVFLLRLLFAVAVATLILEHALVPIRCLHEVFIHVIVCVMLITVTMHRQGWVCMSCHSCSYDA